MTAYLVDPSFLEQLRARINRGCPIIVPSNLSSVERHSATGPGNVTSRSAKLLTSLLALGERIPSLRGWLEGIRLMPANTQLIAEDFDNAPAIAEEWLCNIEKQFSLRGKELKPKSE